MGKYIERLPREIKAQILIAGFTVGGPLTMQLKELPEGKERIVSVGTVQSASADGLRIQGLGKPLDFDRFHPGRIIGIIEMTNGSAIRFG